MGRAEEREAEAAVAWEEVKAVAAAEGEVEAVVAGGEVEAGEAAVSVAWER